MKKVLLMITCLASFFVMAQETTVQINEPFISFEKSVHDFGDITQGQTVTYSFKFKNTGKEPLIISNVLTTCGCTVPTWPKEPIAPGKGGEITASFNSTGKMGIQNKVITIMSNAPQTTITIKANILPKPGDNMRNGQ